MATWRGHRIGPPLLLDGSLWSRPRIGGRCSAREALVSRHMVVCARRPAKSDEADAEQHQAPRERHRAQRNELDQRGHRPRELSEPKCERPETPENATCNLCA